MYDHLSGKIHARRKYYKAPAVIRAKREAPKASKGFKIVKKPKEEGKG